MVFSFRVVPVGIGYSPQEVRGSRVAEAHCGRETLIAFYQSPLSLASLSGTLHAPAPVVVQTDLESLLQICAGQLLNELRAPAYTARSRLGQLDFR